MGLIDKVLVNKEIPTPEFNQRLTVELCENVHLHYRNLRLEFSPAEFFVFIRAMQRIDAHKVLNFKYGPDVFEPLFIERLPEKTEFNSRLQIEEQVGGGFHVHYRNLRLEVKTLEEVGIENKI